MRNTQHYFDKTKSCQWAYIYQEKYMPTFIIMKVITMTCTQPITIYVRNNLPIDYNNRTEDEQKKNQESIFQKLSGNIRSANSVW